MKTPQPLMFAIAVLSIVLTLGFGILSVYPYFHGTTPATASATPACTAQMSRLEITNVVGVPVENKDTHKRGFAFNVFYSNKGSIAATAMVHRSITVTANHLLSPDEEKRYKDEAEFVPFTTSAIEDAIQPGTPPSHYFSVPTTDERIEELFGQQTTGEKTSSVAC